MVISNSSNSSDNDIKDKMFFCKRSRPSTAVVLTTPKENDAANMIVDDVVVVVEEEEKEGNKHDTINTGTTNKPKKTETKSMKSAFSRVSKLIPTTGKKKSDKSIKSSLKNQTTPESMIADTTVVVIPPSSPLSTSGTSTTTSTNSSGTSEGDIVDNDIKDLDQEGAMPKPLDECPEDEEDVHELPPHTTSLSLMSLQNTSSSTTSSRKTNRFSMVSSIYGTTKKKTNRLVTDSLSSISHLTRREPNGSKKKFIWQAQDVHFASGRHVYHGEDADALTCYFHIVADGVSGNQRHSHDKNNKLSSAMLAKELVHCVEDTLDEYTEANTLGISAKMFEIIILDAIEIAKATCLEELSQTIEDTSKITMASTLSVVYFDRWNGQMLTFSLGDCKTIVVRNDQIVYESLAILREFNIPTVVRLNHPTVSSDFMIQTFRLRSGDLCLTFSDGLGDNLYKDDILAIIQDAKDRVQDEQDHTKYRSSSYRNSLTTLLMLQEMCDTLVVQSRVTSSNLQAKSILDQKQSLRQSSLGSFIDDDNDDEASSVRSSSYVSNRTTGSRASELLLDSDLSEEEDDDDDDDRDQVHEELVADISPFASMAALEYRTRALSSSSHRSIKSLAQDNEAIVKDPEEEEDEEQDRNNADEDHDFWHLNKPLQSQKEFLNRHLVVGKSRSYHPSSTIFTKESDAIGNQWHYSMEQLRQFAQMTTKKPDDITVLVSQF